uniref:Uncharacterized protein n=1 Tax=Triticum urartu TaxID=4572 RepID=A0A8R7VFL1_TRIUA
MATRQHQATGFSQEHCNNNYLPGKNVPRANMPYHGIDMPGSGKPTGRFSNGYNTANFVVTSMGFESSPPPYLLLESSSRLLVLTALAAGVNYASSGAGILDSTVSLFCVSYPIHNTKSI